ncbi:MAG: PIN domain-containing protein [Elusimicrobia bacterium]|nr:PIN domain-containing protein [Elusimicrobiota bacterium]
MKPLFVDTGAWYALANRLDSHHDEAREFLAATPRPLLTTNYIILETANLINARVGHAGAARFLEQARASKLLTVHHITPRQHEQAEAYFKSHSDKGYSLGDCSSFIVMGDFGIAEAFTFDKHFAQAGFARVP